MTSTNGYDAALAQAAGIYPGVRVGRPGRSRGWPVMGRLMNVLRLKLSLDQEGASLVAPGPAILVSNHQATWDPVVTVMSTGWRVSAFTKAEWFEGPAAPFFRWVGQIPLRRGDEVSTEWALDMAARALADGGKVGIYPEGTRGPSDSTLYRLHQRVLVALLTGSPDVPVHAVAVRYTPHGRRTHARIRISERLPIDARTMTGQQMTEVIRDRLLTLGELDYCDQYAFVVKARAERERAARAAEAAEGTEES
ncbi:MAG TPA: lysophospholipid acyltransferase family protein [Candidatus Nanopelagicales bacterium]